ncbi:hypothetical protein KBI23_19615 [bacterium]|nr:hypothetical protein [bacterium]MBP9811264.1 hypothetical protein [bacterium]
MPLLISAAKQISSKVAPALALVFGSIALLTSCSYNSLEERDKTVDVGNLPSQNASLTERAPERGNFDKLFFTPPNERDSGIPIGLGNLAVGSNSCFYGKRRSYILAFRPGNDLHNLAFGNLSEQDELVLLRDGKAVKLRNGEPVYSLGTRGECGDVRFRDYQLLKDNSKILAPGVFYVAIQSPPGPSLSKWKTDFNKIMAFTKHSNLQIGQWKGDNDYAKPPMTLWYWNFMEPGLSMTETDNAQRDVAITAHSELSQLVYGITIEKIGMNGEERAKQDEAFEIVRRGVIKALYPDINETALSLVTTKLDESEDPIEDKKGWSMSQVGNSFSTSFGFTSKRKSR